MTLSPERAIPGYQPGHHVCHPFVHDQERDASLVPFSREGLLRGERCAYAAAPAALAHLEARLGAAGVDVTRALARRALVLLPSEEAYGEEVRFDADKTIAFLSALLDESLADGFSGLRGAGELGHAPTEEEIQRLRAYELRVNELFASRPFTALCSYPRRFVGERLAIDLLHAHPHAWIDGELCGNPFFRAAGGSMRRATGPSARAIDSSAGEPALPETLRLIGEHHRAERRDRTLLGALATEAAALARALEQAQAEADARVRVDGAVADGLRRHLVPLRSELRQLHRSMRDGQTPPPAEVLSHLERIWTEARGLAAVAEDVDPPSDRREDDP